MLSFTIGLYRLTAKASIIESTYDYDSRTIGPYTLPVHVHPFTDYNPQNATNMDRLYQVLLNDDDILAVFNNCNRTIVAIHADRIVHHSMLSDINRKDRQLMHQLIFKHRICNGHYRHIGYIKTYAANKSFYMEPYHLVQDINTGIISYFSEHVLKCEPVLNPELYLYKKLIETDYRAVYQDSKTGEIHYI